MNNWRKFIIAAVLFVVIILGISLPFIIIDMINSATISVTVAPSIARVKIDGRGYDAGGNYKVKPGEYDVEISADGFETKTKTIVAVANETTNLVAYLEPTLENSDWYNTHPEDSLIMGEVKNTETIEILNRLSEENPILSKLPYKVEYYTEDYSDKFNYVITYELGVDAETFKIIIKDYMGNGKKLATDWLAGNGATDGTYDVEYKDLSVEFLNPRAT